MAADMAVEAKKVNANGDHNFSQRVPQQRLDSFRSKGLAEHIFGKQRFAFESTARATLSHSGDTFRIQRVSQYISTLSSLSLLRLVEYKHNLAIVGVFDSNQHSAHRELAQTSCVHCAIMVMMH